VSVLIVEPVDGEVAEWLAARHGIRRAPDFARDPIALRRALADADAAILPAGIAVDAALLEAAPRLRAVGRIGGSTDNIDQDACAQRNVTVVRNPVASAMAEAEFMIGALLQMLRRLPQPRGDIYREGRELGASTVGLLGLSPSARAMAQLLAGFGSRVIGYDPAVHASDAVWERWQIGAVPLRDLLASCDALCVQLPFYNRYRGLLGERLLEGCRPNQVIVCIGSSAVFDDAALAQVLGNGTVAAAWFDQIEPGLLEPGKPLVDAQNLFVTPRLAAATRQTSERAAWVVARRIDELLTAPGMAAFSATEPGALAGLAADPATP
jgi:phosphoglycerate dehydrogenase-like enzyme